MTFDKQLGERLRRYRIIRGMTQQDLGRAAGVTFQQIQKYENGVNRMACERLAQISALLQISPIDLLEDTGGSEFLPTPGSRDVRLYEAIALCTPEQRAALRAMVESFL